MDWACGDYCFATSKKYVEILSFKHFYRHVVFTSEGAKIRNKQIKDYIDVSVVIDIEKEIVASIRDYFNLK